MRLSLVSSSTALALLAACSSSSPTAPKTQGGLHLTAAQVQAIVQRLGQLKVSNPALAWIAESASVAIQAGAEVQTLPLTTTNFAPGPFYGVTLQRDFTTASGVTPVTFDLIAFDNPSDPNNFMIIDVGQVQQGLTSPPVAEQAGAYFLQVVNDSVSQWISQAGTASFGIGGATGACPAYQGPAGVTCSLQTMNIVFNITSSEPFPVPEGAIDPSVIAASPTASMSATLVPGVILTFAADAAIQ